MFASLFSSPNLNVSFKLQVTQSCPTTIESMGFSRPEHWSGQPFPSPGDLPNPGIEPRSPTLQADSLPAEPPGQPKNIGMGGLSLLQQMFLTQESNRGLLHYRWILHQLSYQGTTSAIHFMSPAGEHLCFSHACLHYTAHECITIRIN